MRFLVLLPAAVVLLVFRVPMFGRLLAQFVRVVEDLIARLLNLPDVFLRLVGVRLRKKLRLHLIVLRAGGTPVLGKDTLASQCDTARLILQGAAGIDLRLCGIHEDDRDAPAHVLDVHCNARAYLEDLLGPGCWFEAAAGRHAPTAAWSRLLGFGSPLFAVVVRSMACNFLGCSIGVASEYVTITAGGTTWDHELLAHELGHALGLLHRRDCGNLMAPRAGRGRALTAWQTTLMRGSRHVTFW
jgi:hypothetical protein